MGDISVIEPLLASGMAESVDQVQKQVMQWIKEADTAKTAAWKEEGNDFDEELMTDLEEASKRFEATDRNRQGFWIDQALLKRSQDHAQGIQGPQRVDSGGG